MRSGILGAPVLRRLMPAFAVSAVGDGMSAVGVAWLGLRIAPPGDGGLVVGLAVAAYTLPGAAGAVLLSRPLRTLAARHLVAADSALRAAALGVIPVLYALGALRPWSYVTLLAGSSVLHAWGLSGQYTLVAEHLPEPDRAAGNSVLSSFGMAAYVIGPVLAGLAVTLGGPVLPVTADAASFVVLAVMAATAGGRPEAKGHPGAAGQPGATEAADPGDPERARGFAVIRRTRVLAGLLVLSLVYFFLYGPVEVALPLYVTGSLGGGAGLLSLFWTVFGVGATVGSLAAGTIRRVQVRTILLVAVIGWGAALAPLGLTHQPVVALICFAVGGLLYAPYTAMSATLFQRHSPPGALSQVLAARGALTVMAAPLGSALGGPLIAWTGAQHTLLASAIATIACGLVATVMWRGR